MNMNKVPTDVTISLHKRKITYGAAMAMVCQASFACRRISLVCVDPYLLLCSFRIGYSGFELIRVQTLALRNGN